MSYSTVRPFADVDFEGKVRARDPETSWKAAGRQTRRKGEILRAQLLVMLEQVGPMTDDELIAFRKRMQDRYPELRWADATPQNIRSRRSELEKKYHRVRPLIGVDGNVVMRPSAYGNPAQVWEWVPE